MKWYHRLMFWRKKQRFIILVCYKGEAENFLFFKYAKTAEEVKREAGECLNNTMGWKAYIHYWDPFEGRAVGLLATYDTFNRNVKDFYVSAGPYDENDSSGGENV